MGRETLKKQEILRGKDSFKEVFEKGEKLKGKWVVIFVVSAQQAQMGIAVSKKYRRAVDRNRIKRLIREIYRKNKEWFQKKKLFFTFPTRIRCPATGSFMTICLI